MRTSRAATLAAAIVLTAVAAAGYAVHRDHHGVRPVAVKSPLPLLPTAAPREPVLHALDSAAPRPSVMAVRGALNKPARVVAAAAHLVGEVVDARTGSRLWAVSADQPEPPASTTKLLTAAAALSTLGPNQRFATTTRLSGHTLYLVGGGDPTVLRSPSSYVASSYPPRATMSALATQTAKALGPKANVTLRLDASAWTGPKLARGWKPSYISEGDLTPPSALEVDEGRITPSAPDAPRSTHPVTQAGAVFADLLRRDGVTITGKPREETAPGTARLVGRIASPTVAELVQQMLSVSDDDLAEALGRAVAIDAHRPATFRGAGKAVTHAVATLGVPTAGVHLEDTSGLSHDDRISPRTLVGVLRAAVSSHHAALSALLEGLPVAGFTGTLADRYLTAPDKSVAGVLRAKTGTLTGVNALSGMVVDRGGRLLLFAFLASDAPSPGLTVPALDALASRLGRCGCDR